MKSTSKVRFIALAGACRLATQTAGTDAATLAKYDKNHNGKLDPDELAAMQRVQNEAVQLSTFVVRTDQDRGYQAADAGSGGRVDMPFKLLPAAMSGMTKEFLEDWAVTDMRESFRYAMNVDVANNSAPNTSPFGDFQFNFRGVGDSGNYPTRNYFLYYGNSDSYNTERFEFARGPNSVLFGDGQIGGVATTMTKQAKLGRDAYEVSARYDSWGGLRGTLDANKVLSPRQAVRVNAVYNRNTYGSAWRDNAKMNEKGIDFAWGYKFTPSTSLRPETEWMNTKRMLYATTYADNYGYYTPGTVYDGVTAFTSAQQTALGVTPVSTQAQNWTYIPAEASLGVINTGGSGQYRSAGPGFAIRPEGRGDLPGIVSPAKLPSREFNLGPNDTWSRYKYQVCSFYLDHKFADGVSGQISFYDYNNDRNTFEGGFANSLQYDINKFLPGTTTPNPKLGVLYGELTPSRSYQENYVYEWRGLVTWKTRLPFNGRGQLSGIVGNRSERFEARGLSPARVDGPNQVWTAAENTLRYRYYVDGANRYGFGNLPPDRPGFTYRWIQTGFASVEHKDIQYVQAVAATSFWEERVSVLAGVRNDDLVDDQYGNISGFNDAHGLQGYGGFVPGTGTRPGAHNLTKAGALTYNYGGTAWIDRRKTVGVFYNWSKNFAPPTSGLAKFASFNKDGTFNGEPFGVTSGHEKSFGLRFSFLDGQITAEARKYESLQVDRIDNGTSPTGFFRSAWQNSGPSYNGNADLATNLDWRDIAALSAKGYEFQGTANFKGLRLQANYSLPETANIDIRPGGLAYASNFVPIWQKWVADGKNDRGETLLVTEISNLNTAILNVQNNIAGSAPGTVNNGTNKWTGSLAATYQFGRETPLNGFSLGFGFTGRGQRKNGSITPQILYNTPNGVNPTPQQNRDAAFQYLNTPAYNTVDMNLAYRRRIGSYNYRFQVNVSNLTNKKDLLYTGYSTYRVKGNTTTPLLGMYANGFTWLDPRRISFTTTVAF
ncbi:MAG: TonB-dependent receptor plug domain-containing protein [Verrucomicrobia bacterium]|nr:TonB-dependent receptor plug domain-containing protein [Verrucomicrobiota bacterium]